MIERTFQIINGLLANLAPIQTNDSRFEMLFRRLEQIQRILVGNDPLTISLSTNSPTLIKLNSLLSKTNVFFEMRILPVYHSTELDTINSELMNILLELTIDPMQKVKLLAEILKNDQKLEQEKYEAEIRERQALRKTLLYVQLANNKEVLRSLNDEFENLIKQYVDKCIKIHLTIPIRGINKLDIDHSFTSTFYSKESNNKMKLDMSAMAQVNIPVNSVHIQLRADKSTAFERRQARDFLLHTIARDDKGSSVSNEDIWKKLASAPYMPSLLERDRFSNEKQKLKEQISPAKAIQLHRWMVILGDPGSGKTTLVRWLTLQFAQAFQQNDGQGVQLSFLDENTSQLEKIHVGPLRLPITIRLGEYADAVRLNSSLSLFDYIGEHTWLGDSFYDSLSQRERNQLSDILKHYVRAGQTFIVLDGLDEIPESENRSRIVERVETFVEQYVQTPSSISAFDQDKYGGLGWITLSDLDAPQNCGGNQIIVTSRIVGYHANPLKGSFVHFTIEPLGLTNIEIFVDYWFDGVHRQLLNILDLAPQERIIQAKVEKHTAMLKSEIRNSDNRGLRELISNSFLLSAICSMSFRAHRQGITTVTLPNHRVHLYEDAIEWMLNAWQIKDPTMNMIDVKRTLCQLATYIHENSASGLIDHSTLIELCRSNDDERAIHFTRIIRDEVGVLTARGEFAYGFLHLTFQEYLTGLDIIFDKHSIEKIVQKFIDKISNPRYREPLLLALGLISWKWSQKEYDLFCGKLLEEQQHQNENFTSLVPLGALLLVSSLNDLVKLPSDTLIFDAFDQLLIASGKHQWFIDHPNLSKIIIQGLQKLTAVKVNKWAVRFLTPCSSRTISDISAFCHCLIKINMSSDVNLRCSWIDSRIINLLWNYLFLENEDNEFIIDFTLMQLVHLQPSLFDSPRLHFRSFVMIRQQSIPPFLLPLIIAVYGGLSRNSTTNEVVFSAEYIHRDSSLTPILRRYFIHQNKDEELPNLTDYCKQIIENLNPSDCSLEGVDCFLGLFCLMGIEERNFLKFYSQYKAFKIAQQRMKRILSHLCHIYFGSENKMTTILTDATNILNIYINKTNPLDMTLMFNYTSALLYATNCLVSGKTSFLFSNEESSSDVMKSPELFQNIEELEKILFTNENVISLPKLLRLFWPVVQSLNKDHSYEKCAQLDACGQIMALGHDTQPTFALAFLPQWLEDIYIIMLKHDELVFNEFKTPLSNNFSLVHVLADLGKTFDNASTCMFSTILSIVILYPLFKQVKLEYFAASFIWRLSSTTLKAFFNGMTKIMTTDRMMKALDMKDQKLDDLVASLSDEDETEIIRCAIDTELQRYTEIVTNTVRDDCHLYSCALSLSHICWFDATVNKWTLFRNALHVTTLISNVASRLHLITVILSHRVIHEHVDLNDLLNDQFSTVLNMMFTADMSPFVTVFLLGRCAEHMYTSDDRRELMQKAINKFNHLLKCSSQEEAYIFDRFLQSMFPEYSNLDSIVLYSSKSSLLHQQLNSMTNTSEYSLREQMTLSSCYLANLSVDIHKLDYVPFDMKQPFDTTLSELLMTSNDNLSINVALLIDRWTVSMRADDYQRLDDFLHNFIYVDPGARLSVSQWLNFDDDKRQFLSFHASLLLARSSMWSTKVMSILCDLLLNKDDRYRQRAEDILQSKGLRWRSSELSWLVFQTLINKHFSYHDKSAYASVVTLWTFEKIEIDDIDHLDKLLIREKELVQKELIINDYDEQQTRSQVFTIRAAINRVSSLVLHHFIKIVEDAVKKCSTQDIMSSVENRIDTHFVLHIFSISSIFIRAVSFQDKMLVDMCDRILHDKQISVPICKAVLFALRYCGNEGLLLLRSFFLTPHKEITIVSTAIESYCYRVSDFYCDLSDEKKNTEYSLSTIIDLLNNPSEEIAQTAASGLARIYASCNDGLSILIKTLNNDSMKCYTALLNATRDTMLTDTSQNAIEKCAECIEQNTSLLPLFILELYQNICHYDSTLKIEYILFNRGGIQFVEVAALLVKSMSAAFRAEVERCGLTNQIKQALFFTSKQHNFPRRAACIAVLSCFGDLTVNMCNMFLSGLLDTHRSQKTVYECVTRIQHVSELDSHSILDPFLSSPSMNTRYAVARLLILLTRQGVITVKNCQDSLCRMIINMSSSFKHIWLHQEEWDWDAISNYECVGRLDRIVYRMLIDMSFGMSLEADNVSSIRNNLLQDSNHNGQLDRFFEQMMKTSEHARLRNVGKREKFVINIDVDDSNDMAPQTFNFGHHHEHFPSAFFQSLCLKSNGYTVPIEIRNALTELNEIAVKNGVDLVELLPYAIPNEEE